MKTIVFLIKWLPFALMAMMARAVVMAHDTATMARDMVRAVVDIECNC